MRNIFMINIDETQLYSGVVPGKCLEKRVQTSYKFALLPEKSVISQLYSQIALLEVLYTGFTTIKCLC